VTPDLLLRRALDGDPARPVLTYYDSDGARVELSVATLGNWVAKTANLLVDGLGAAPGQRVAIRLPVHWQAAVWHAACWAAGLVTVLGEPVPAPDVAVVPVPTDLATAPDPVASSAGEVVGLGLGPLGLPRPGPAAPAWVSLDYDREVHGHGDRFPRPSQVSADAAAPAVEADGAVLTAGALVEDADARASTWALPDAARVLVLRPVTDLPALAATLLVPLLRGGGAVLCGDADTDRLAAWARDERVTAVLGPPVGVLPGLATVT